MIKREIIFNPLATFVSGLAMFIHKSDVAEEKSATGALVAIAITIKLCLFNFSSSSPAVEAFKCQRRNFSHLPN